jgi:hypothetical protein
MERREPSKAQSSRREKRTELLDKTKSSQRHLKFTPALTLTLSRPTGEGTAIEPADGFVGSCSQSRALVFPNGSARFSLSHRMGEGRGEGEQLVQANPRQPARVFINILKSEVQETLASSPD